MSSSRRVLFAMGLVFSPLYALLMRLRAWLYRRNLLLRREQMAVPVISIGNLTMGGTGKTPLVIYVAGLLRGMGLHPAILSRGYGRRVAVGDRVLVVSSGAGGEEGPLVGADQAGDEPVLLARLLPDIPVLVAARRVLSGRYAVESMAADCLLLDDGFQHLALARDLDLVLFSARDLPCGARVFPGGPLREPWSALERADALVITGVDDGNRQKVERFRRFLSGRLPATPCFFGEYLPVCLLDGLTGKSMALDKGRGKPLYGFAGIAQPRSFRETLQKENFLVTGFRPFADHHPYTAADWTELTAAARARRAGGLITTEKDLVKLQPLAGDYPLLALRVALFMEASFDNFLREKIASYCGPHS